MFRLQKPSLHKADQRQELKLQVYDGEAGGWHTTVSWLRVNSNGHCVQTKAGTFCTLCQNGLTA